MIEREGFAFPVEVVYEKLPPICDYSGIIGHSISSCRQNSKKKDSDTVSKSKVNQVYRVKNPSSIPTRNPELETEFTGKSSSPLVLNVPSDIRVGKNPENPTDHADDIDKERSPPPENPHDVELVISASPKIDAHDSEKHALIDANISETDPFFNTFVVIINHIKNLSPVQNEPLPTTPSVDFVETSMDKVVKKNNESSESPVSAPPGFETWADPEVNSTNIAIQHNTSDSPLSAPQALSLRRNLGLMIVMKMPILQHQKLLLRIMFFSKRWNWFCMQRVFLVSP